MLGPTGAPGRPPVLSLGRGSGSVRPAILTADRTPPGVKSSRRGARSALSLQEDIRNLWTTATLSQSKLDVPLSNVCELSDMEISSVGSKTGGPRKGGHDSDVGWDESDDKDSFKQEMDEQTSLKLELDRGSSRGSSRLGEEYKTETDKSSSLSSISASKQTPHRAYWMEQQNRLPLPLLELMESEALEVLTKALRSYRSEIGRDHVLTQQLHRYIEGLKRHRNKRTHIPAH
ncbi:Cation channel sperm-associated protein subunit zeta [Galemys pyrenaicus]|uniref:Cation channel sperm-associated protein subunit zeta n=1 Tax=Galemys pyrenaicus TaxID=202257 RepID=A0A8J6DWS4_GALPY|nr:Cation channel sperm-associated protein subunit zeta [Galemys pyrenaicus]